MKQDKSKENEKKKLSPIQPRTQAKPSLPVQIKTERPDSPDVQIMSVTKPGKLNRFFKMSKVFNPRAKDLSNVLYDVNIQL